VDLARLNIESSIARTINFDDVFGYFARKKTRKAPLLKNKVSKICKTCRIIYFLMFEFKKTCFYKKEKIKILILKNR